MRARFNSEGWVRPQIHERRAMVGTGRFEPPDRMFVSPATFSGLWGFNGIVCRVLGPCVLNHPKCINWRRLEHGGRTSARNRTLPTRRSCLLSPREASLPAGHLDIPLIHRQASAACLAAAKARSTDWHIRNCTRQQHACLAKDGFDKLLRQLMRDREAKSKGLAHSG
jgi:hypothetical protein